MNTQPTNFSNLQLQAFDFVLKYPIHSLPSRYCLPSSHSANHLALQKVHRSTGIIMLPVPSSYSLRYSVRHGSEPYCSPLLNSTLAGHLPSSRPTADYKAIPWHLQIRRHLDCTIDLQSEKRGYVAALSSHLKRNISKPISR
ncbi:unnamed protein product [Parnassius mnemosyne]|uniref:Uncharacterized protein n=1 Tax=Parnassius mnemosyne TaxID=213953 RepID=A0AAV1KM67_9NEOP